MRVATLKARRNILPIALLIVLTGLAFQQVLQCDFVNFDDDFNVYENEHVWSFSADNVRWMFTQVRAGHYHPLTWLSFALDYRVWGGLRPLGFHLTNLILHIATVVGFYAVCLTLLRITSRRGDDDDALGSGEAANTPGRELRLRWSAAVGAALFAVHPLRVESVAWVTERRDVLSGAWLMLCVWSWLRATQSQRRRAYAGWIFVSLAAYMLSLLSKAWGITLPAILVLLDIWPLKRIRREARPSDERFAGARIWMEKALFAVPALAAAAAALAAQNASGALQPLDSYPISRRLVQSAYAIMFYPAKTIAPFHLIPVYGWPAEVSELYFPASVGTLAFVAVCVFAWRTRARWPALSVICAAYVILVSPVLGLAQSGPQLVADRYTYIAMLPAAAGAAAAMLSLLDRHRADRRRIVHVALGAAAVVAVLARLTQSQVPVWRDRYSLWEHQLKVCPDSSIGHVNLAAALFVDSLDAGKSGREKERVDLAEESLKHYRRALEVRPQYLIAARGVGRCLVALDRPQEAHDALVRALSIKPDDTETQFDLADAKSTLGRLEEAIDLYRKVASGSSEWEADARFQIGRLLILLGRPQEAIDDLAACTRLEPDNGDGYTALSEAYIKLDRDEEAAAALERLLKIAPGNLAGEARLAFVLASTNVASLRDPARALSLATKAFAAAPPGGIEFHEGLAAACAANGQFDRAISLLDEILKNAKSADPPSWVERLNRQRERYRAGQALEE